MRSDIIEEIGINEDKRLYIKLTSPPPKLSQAKKERSGKQKNRCPRTPDHFKPIRVYHLNALLF